jgi:hypothetical protein
MAESAEGARLLSECRVKSSTEGSNPSLSATLSQHPIARFFQRAIVFYRMAKICNNCYHGHGTYLDE